MSDVDQRRDGEQHSVLADLFCGLTAVELAQLRDDVQFGRISPPIVVECLDG